MSNALAIATVTTALAGIVNAALGTADVGGATVVTKRPEAEEPAVPHVRVFLYQVTPNAALRNRDLPHRASNGELTGRPTVALDLHYLLVFYGNEADLEPQRMLGAVVRDLHARPVLMGPAIKSLVSQHEFLSESNLADAVEQVKFTPSPLTLDDLSKLWSTFFQTPYALSVAYQATAVLIESDETGPAIAPVLSRGKDSLNAPDDHGVDTVLGPFPIVESMHVGEGDDDAVRLGRPSYPAARLGAVITIRGRNLGGDEVRVLYASRRFGVKGDATIPASDRSPTQIRFTLPSDAGAQAAAVAGTYDVTVVTVRGGTPHASTSLPLALAPQILSIAPPSPLAGGGEVVILTIGCAPQVRPEQTVRLLLHDHEVPARSRDAATGSVTFDVSNAPVVEKRLVRLRVDGIDSLPFKPPVGSAPLAFDDNQRVTIVA